MVFHIANKSGIAAKEERNEFVNITQFVAQNGRYFLILQPENFLNSFVQMLQGGGLLSCQAERFFPFRFVLCRRKCCQERHPYTTELLGSQCAVAGGQDSFKMNQV